MTHQRGNPSKRLSEPSQPKDINEFRDSSKLITDDDIKLYYQAATFHIQKKISEAKKKYHELLSRKHLKTNKIVKSNLKSLDAKK